MKTKNKTTVTQQVNIIMPTWLKSAGQEIAKSKGVTFSEFVKDCIKREIQSQNNPAN